MRRLILLGLLLVSSAVGCRSAEKDEPVGAVEPSYQKLPDIIVKGNWWKKGEMADCQY